MTKRRQMPTLIELRFIQNDAARRMAPAWKDAFAALANMQAACANRIAVLAIADGEIATGGEDG